MHASPVKTYRWPVSTWKMLHIIGHKENKTMRYPLTSISLSKIKKIDCNKCWWGCRADGTFRHCWWELKQDGPTSSETGLAVSSKAKCYLFPLLSICVYPGEVKVCVLTWLVGSGFICNSPWLEGAVAGWVGKEAVACSTQTTVQQ